MSARVRLDIEYDGTEFAGWQIQPRDRTVQGELRDALRTVLRDDDVTIVGAGRTDAGVHARGQVAHVDVPDDAPEPYRIAAGVNAITGRDVAVARVTPVGGDFHARFSATARTYRYRIARVPTALDHRLVWHVASDLDVEAMRAASLALVGKYPATSWCAARARDTNAVVDVRSARVFEVGDEIVFDILANRFVMHMVRAIVGTLVEIGRHARPQDSIPELIAAQDRSCAGETAPPRGLCLENVEYGTDADTT